MKQECLLLTVTQSGPLLSLPRRHHEVLIPFKYRGRSGPRPGAARGRAGCLNPLLQVSGVVRITTRSTYNTARSLNPLQVSGLVRTLRSKFPLIIMVLIISLQGSFIASSLFSHEEEILSTNFLEQALYRGRPALTSPIVAACNACNAIGSNMHAPCSAVFICSRVRMSHWHIGLTG